MIDGVFSDSEEEFFAAYSNVQNFIRAFYGAAGSARNYEIRHHTAVIAWVMAEAASDLKHLPQPSIFKKAGQFTLKFVLNNPVITELPDAWYLDEIPRRNFQNALVAFEICRKSLHGALIIGSDGKQRLLEVEITPSRHQLGDIFKCLATIQPVVAAHDSYSRLLALLYESLAYEFNPKCRYTPEQEVP